MEKYIYIHDSDKFVERIPFSGLKKKKSKASAETRSTRVRRTTFVVGKYSFVDPPIKLAFRRFWSRFEKFGIVVSRGGERAEGERATREFLPHTSTVSRDGRLRNGG